MKTNHEAVMKAAAQRQPTYMVWVPGEPGAVAAQVCGMADAVEMFPTEEEVECLLHGFKRGVESAGGEPVCVVETGENAETLKGNPPLTCPGRGADEGKMLKAETLKTEGAGQTTEKDAVVARREFICRATRALRMRLVLVRRTEWRSGIVRVGTDAVTVAEEWFPKVPVRVTTAEALLLLAWAMTDLKKGGC